MEKGSFLKKEPYHLIRALKNVFPEDFIVCCASILPFLQTKIYWGCTVLLSHCMLGKRYVDRVWIKNGHFSPVRPPCVTPQWREEYKALRDPGVLNRSFELPLLNMERVHCLLEEELAWFRWPDGSTVWSLSPVPLFRFSSFQVYGGAAFVCLCEIQCSHLTCFS